MAKASASPIETVVIHPLVLLSAVDHYNRVAKDTKKRVVGVLLGETYKGKVSVSNCYGVPFEEDRRDTSIWFLDHNFHENMYEMFRKVNAKEKVVGWYSTGPKIRAADLEITELFRKYCKNPLLVIINVAPTDDLTIPTEAYLSVESSAEEKSTSERTFQHIPTEMGASEPEEIGVEHLLRDLRDTTVSTLTTKIEHKVSSLKNLSNRVQEIDRYLQNVFDGKLPSAHPKIVYLLQEIYNLSPNLQVEQLQKSFAVKGNDMLLVVYLCSMIRAIISLHNLINNHQMNKDAEIKAKEDKDKAQQKAAKEKAEKEGEKAKEKGENDDKEKTTSEESSKKEAKKK